MTIVTNVLILVSWVMLWHFVADFVAQNDWMATNKSSNWMALSLHVGFYSLIMFAFVGMAPYILWDDKLWFLAITFVSHFSTDAITSRITSYLWKKEKRHWFFVTVGFDQLIHAVTLFWTLWYVVNWETFR